MNRTRQTLRLTLTALMMSMNIVLSFQSLVLYTPFGNIYFCNVVINVAGVLLDPIAAFVVGGVGSLLGDLFSASPAMVVSLFAHGLQGLVVSLSCRGLRRIELPLRSMLGMLLGSVVMIIGYTIGRTYVYGDRTFAFAASKILMELLQAGFGIALAMLLLFPMGLLNAFHREMGEDFGLQIWMHPAEGEKTDVPSDPHASDDPKDGKDAEDGKAGSGH